jgi:hypothetical protein
MTGPLDPRPARGCAYLMWPSPRASTANGIQPLQLRCGCFEGFYNSLLQSPAPLCYLSPIGFAENMRQGEELRVLS